MAIVALRRFLLGLLGLDLGVEVGPAAAVDRCQAAGLGYSPLPANVVSIAHQTLLGIENSAGKPLFS